MRSDDFAKVVQAEADGQWIEKIEIKASGPDNWHPKFPSDPWNTSWYNYRAVPGRPPVHTTRELAELMLAEDQGLQVSRRRRPVPGSDFPWEDKPKGFFWDTGNYWYRLKTRLVD